MADVLGYAAPRSAAWRHRDVRQGFEVVFLAPGRLEGTTAAVEDGAAWTVRYVIELEGPWRTRAVRLTGRSQWGPRAVALEADAAGRWRVDGEAAPHLDGCLDVDLESSALTNALPVHRLGLRVGEAADVPAAYVRAADLRVERLDQRYARMADTGGRQRYHYAAPRFDFECELVYDESGLLLDYPGLATRVA